jgi:hypothetical protein
MFSITHSSLKRGRIGRIAAPLTAAIVFVTLVLGAGPASATTLHAFTTHPVPKISGAAKLGLPLTVKVGTWKPKGTSYTYQWKVASHSVAGATTTKYTPIVADLGHRVTVTVTAHKAGYKALSRTSLSTKKVVYQTFMTKAGLYSVGSKVKTHTITAGTYVARHATSKCYWQRIGAANIFGSILGQEYLKGQAVATIESSDTAFQTGGCGSWLRLSDVPTKLLTTVPSSGDYLVNTQLQPGVYRATALGSTCSWKTVRSFSGNAAIDVIDHGEPTSGPVDVTITTDIAGFLVDNCGTWTLQ